MSTGATNLYDLANTVLGVAASALAPAATTMGTNGQYLSGAPEVQYVYGTGSIPPPYGESLVVCWVEVSPGPGQRPVPSTGLRVNQVASRATSLWVYCYRAITSGLTGSIQQGYTVTSYNYVNAAQDATDSTDADTK